MADSDEWLYRKRALISCRIQGICPEHAQKNRVLGASVYAGTKRRNARNLDLTCGGRRYGRSSQRRIGDHPFIPCATSIVVTVPAPNTRDSE